MFLHLYVTQGKVVERGVLVSHVGLWIVSVNRVLERGRIKSLLPSYCEFESKLYFYLP